MSLKSPLQWPTGWERTPSYSRAKSPFKVEPAKARRELYDELERLGATSVVITTNAKLNLDGSVAAKQPFGTDPAVAVYFTRKGRDFCIPCDRYQSMAGNVRAVGLTVANIRAQERWGTSQIVDAMFTGLAALPPGGETRWWTVLGVSPDASQDDVVKAHRDLARAHHPDLKGNENMFVLIQEAYQQALAAIAARG